MSNIFSLVNPPSRTPAPTPTTAVPTPPEGGIGLGPSNPTSSSTHNPEPWNPPPPPVGTAAMSNPVLVLYSRRLTAQTEALYSLLQTSLAEIKGKQEGLGTLLGQAEKQVKVLEGKVGEVVGKVGEEVNQTLTQLRCILSTTNSVLLAMDAKLIERESGNGSLLRRVDRIENRIGIAIAGVERVERVLVEMQQMEKRLVSHMIQLAQQEMHMGSCKNCGSGEGSGGGGVNYEKKEEAMEEQRQKRNRNQSVEIPCSWNLEKIVEVEGEDQGEEGEREPESEPEPEPKPGPIPKPAQKRRRLMSDNEILEMELNEIKRVRNAEAQGLAYSEEPDDFGEGYKGELEEEMGGTWEGGEIVEVVPELPLVVERMEMKKGGGVSGVKAKAVAMGMKKRIC